MAADSIDELSSFELPLPHDLGRYRLEAEIGRGGMGIVYLGHDTMLDRPVAIKLLLPQLAADVQFVQRFTREAQMAARLEHPNIVTVHDVGQSEGLVYFVMRMVHGRPMDRLLSEGMSWTTGEPLAVQIADAIAFAHAHGVIHRDIKPENVIVGKDGSVTITDFGLARPEQQSGGPTRAGVILGTPDYMAPEQALGGTVDARTDIYSFGVMLFEMIAAKLPFEGNSPFAVINQHINSPAPRLRSVAADAPPYLDQLVARCLEKEADKRPASMSEVRDVLRGQIGTASEQTDTSAGHDAVARVRRGELSLASAMVDFPDQAELLEKLFRRELTSVSLDLAGSTQLKLTSGGTIAIGPVLNSYRELVDRSLREHEVLDVVWAGDGTVALFEMPSQAVSAAQAVVVGLREVNKRYPNSPDIDVRIGIHTGSILRDPNQSLGQVASSTLDICGHIQKDAHAGLVEISEVTLDKLTSREGWVPLRRARDGNRMVYAWHPDGADHVPRSWVSKLVRSVAGGEEGTSSTRISRVTTATSQQLAAAPQVVLNCHYCQTAVRVQDQKCPGCGRLNRHYDPNIDERGRRKRTTIVTAPPKPAVKAADARRTTMTGATQPGRASIRGKKAEEPTVPWGHLVFGMSMSVTIWLMYGLIVRQAQPDFLFISGTPKNWAGALPLILVGPMILNEIGVQPMSAFGMIMGIPLGWFLCRALNWL